MKEKKVAIITGAGQGIGLEIARQLVLENYRVVLNDLDLSLCESAEMLLNNVEADSCVSVHGDSSEPAFIEIMINTAISTFGRLDTVIANAGITLFGDFFTFSENDFEKLMHVNLRGTFFLVQKATNVIKSNSIGGSVVLMSSVVGHQAHQHLAAYAMSKAAIEMLAKNLVIDLSPYKIRINTVAPGATLTERTLSDSSFDSTWSKITPLGKPAEVVDIANTVMFLISDKAKHITGQSIVVDGGWTSVSPSPF
jgi:glucose 1-dehydrogenase